MGIHKWAFKVDYHPDNGYCYIFTGVMTKACAENSPLTNENTGIMTIKNNPRS